MKRILFILFSLLFCSSAYGADCTILNAHTCMTAGADTLTVYETDEYGTSSGTEATIWHVFTTHVGAGDTIKLEAGKTFRWTHEFGFSGTAGSRVTLTSTTGSTSDRPKIDNSIYECCSNEQDVTFAAYTANRDDWPGGDWGGGADLASTGYTAPNGTVESFEWCQSTKSGNTNAYFALKGGANCSSFDEDDCPALQDLRGTTSGIVINGTRRTKDTSSPLDSDNTWGFFTVSGETGWTGSRAFKTYYIRGASAYPDPNGQSASYIQVNSLCPRNVGNDDAWTPYSPSGIIDLDSVAYWDLSYLIIQNGHGDNNVGSYEYAADGLMVIPNVAGSTVSNAISVSYVKVDHCDQGLGPGAYSTRCSSCGDDEVVFNYVEVTDTGKYPAMQTSGYPPGPGGGYEAHGIYSMGGTMTFNYCWIHHTREGTCAKFDARSVTFNYGLIEDCYTNLVDIAGMRYETAGVTTGTYTFLGTTFIDNDTFFSEDGGIAQKISMNEDGGGSGFTKNLYFYYCTLHGIGTSSSNAYYADNNDGTNTTNLRIYNSAYYNINDDLFAPNAIEAGRWDSIDIRNSWFSNTEADWSSGTVSSVFYAGMTSCQFGGATNPFATGTYVPSSNSVLRYANNGIGTVPTMEYVATASSRSRSAALDVGAYEYGGDVSAPSVTGCTISTAGTTATITFDEPVVMTDYDTGEFNLDCSSAGSNVNLSSPSGSGSSWSFTIADTIGAGEICNIDFTGDANSIEDIDWNDLATFSDTSVTNNSTVDITSPIVVITSPTSSSTYSTSVSTITLAGTSSTDTSYVTYSLASGGNGNCTGTTSWTCSSISLTSGSNVISVNAYDGSGNLGTDAINVTYTPPTNTGCVIPGNLR